MKNRILLVLFALILIIVIMYFTFRKRPTKEIAFRKWSMDPKLYKNRDLKGDMDSNMVMIPEYVLRNMVPSIILDKYLPDSVINNMPHKKERYIKIGMKDNKKLGEDIIGKNV